MKLILISLLVMTNYTCASDFSEVLSANYFQGYTKSGDPDNSLTYNVQFKEDGIHFWIKKGFIQYINESFEYVKPKDTVLPSLPPIPTDVEPYSPPMPRIPHDMPLDPLSPFTQEFTPRLPLKPDLPLGEVPLLLTEEELMNGVRTKNNKRMPFKPKCSYEFIIRYFNIEKIEYEKAYGSKNNYNFFIFSNQSEEDNVNFLLI
jgi:hypothetical protein